MKYKVCYVTSTRADYNPLRATILKLNNQKEIDFKLVVTGTHLLKEYGNTYKDIIKDGITNFDKVKINLGSGSKKEMTGAIGGITTVFIKYFKKYNPDLLLLCGDRFEIYAVAKAAFSLGIRIAHISGGDITEGAMDDYYRNEITKMSVLHFPGNEESRRRIILMGKNSKTVFNVGEPGIENIVNIKKINRKKLSNKLSFDLTKDYAVVTCHPETIGKRNIKNDMKEIINSLNSFDMNYIICKSNADAGGIQINKIWEKESKKHNNWLFVSNLDTETFINCLRNSKMIIGNSSSGILEAPTIGIPTVNIGNRQKGRMMADSVIACDYKEPDITKAIKKALKLNNKKYYLYGNGKTSDKIIKYLLSYLRK